MSRLCPGPAFRAGHAFPRVATATAALLVLVTASLLTGCSSGADAGATASDPPSTGSSGATAASTTATASPSVSAVPRATAKGMAPATLAGRCGTDITLPADLPAPFTFATADGQTLVGVEFGTGPKGVVTLHELGSAGLCGWVPYALRLAAAGMHVLVFDHRCVGLSTCPNGPAGGDLLADTAAARQELLRRGATDTALLGASQGGGEAISAAASQPGWSRAVVLSGALFDLDFGGGVTPTGVVGSLAVPVLFLVNGNDPDSPLVADQTLVAAAPPGRVDFQVVAEQGHGWALLQSFPGGPFSALADQVAAFLAA